jgi:putative PIN family toxin of toxin-antitoxin system
MKVFLDTNVLASAAATRGLCADVVREVFGRHESVISKQVLDELGRVLRYKFGLPKTLSVDFISVVRQDSILAKPGKMPDVKLRDKDDVKILAAAIASGADVLLTGDAELVALGSYEDMVILSPRQFWERLTAGGSPANGGKT